MPSASEIKEQVASESERRGRLAVPAFAGGILYLLSAIIISSTLGGAPTVGLLEGLAPALSGTSSAAVSPRTGEVKYFSHHAYGLISGSALAGIAIAALTLTLLLLVDATRFRRPNSWAIGRPLVLIGGISLAILSVGHQVVSSIETHNFAVGHDFSAHAVDQALTKSTANMLVEYLDLLAGVALAAGMIGTMVNAMRVGLLPRWMSYLGIFTGILIFAPIGGAELEVVPSFWMVMMGILYIGKWPNEEPPAWAAGEARPWPSQAETRAAKRGEGQVALATGVADVAPDPARPTRSSRRRRRKRGAGR
jgi:hypothetical protein